MVAPSANSHFPFKDLPLELRIAIMSRLPDSDRKTTAVVDKWFTEMTAVAARSVEWRRVESFFKTLTKKLGIVLCPTLEQVNNLSQLRDGLKKEKEKAVQALAALELDSLLPFGDPQSPHYIRNCPFSKDFFKIAEYWRKAHGYAKGGPNLLDDQNDLILQGAKELVSLGEEDIAIKLCHTYYPHDLQSSKLYKLTRMLLGPLVHRRDFDAAHLQAGMKIIDACYKIVASIKEPEQKCLALQTHLFFAYLCKVRLYLKNNNPALAAAELERMETVLHTFFPAVSDKMSDEIQSRLMPFLLLGYIRTGQVERAIVYVEQTPAEKTDLKLNLVHTIIIEFCRLNLTDEIVRVVSNYASGLGDKKDLLLADLAQLMCFWLRSSIPSSEKALDAVAFAIERIENPSRKLTTKFGPFGRLLACNASHYLQQNARADALAILNKWFAELDDEALASSTAIDAISIYCNVAQIYAGAGEIHKAFSLHRHLHPSDKEEYLRLYKSAQKMVRTLLDKLQPETVWNALHEYQAGLKIVNGVEKGRVLFLAGKDEYFLFSHRNTYGRLEEIDNISPFIDENDDIDERKIKILTHVSKLLHWDKMDQIPQLVAKHLEGLSEPSRNAIKTLIIAQILDNSRYSTLSDQSFELTLAFVIQQFFETITDPTLKAVAHMVPIADAVRELVRRKIRAGDVQGAVALLDVFFENMPDNHTPNGLESIFLYSNFALLYVDAGRIDRALQIHRDLRPHSYPEEDALYERTVQLARYIYLLYEQPELPRAVASYRSLLAPNSEEGRFSLHALEKWCSYLLYFYGLLC